MHIIADANMPGLEPFEAFATVERVDGRTLTREQLGEAEILLVRSVTRVDATLLAGSRVRFVGSATIGTDHVDLAYLAQAGIPFAHAPGCNARAVAECAAIRATAVRGPGAMPAGNPGGSGWPGECGASRSGLAGCAGHDGARL